MAIQPWRKGIVTRIKDETHNIRRFWIKIPELERFDFEPGQFVTLDLPIHEKPNKRWRSYSIASWPDGTNVFELCIVLLDGGAGIETLAIERPGLHDAFVAIAGNKAAAAMGTTGNGR